MLGYKQMIYDLLEAASEVQLRRIYHFIKAFLG